MHQNSCEGKMETLQPWPSPWREFLEGVRHHCYTPVVLNPWVTIGSPREFGKVETDDQQVNKLQAPSQTHDTCGG
ncbi:hypothetical protein Pmani_026978 [Petrolisthes manimaculis]|uniref:Uncharacterized protein n=1 Tax=Petrolisthes manimaculis TaxID=1843537 RepID=A0AAE1P2J4_9EUCA|nr:hypothetical protein Pmani_026978 [Petrolisthes manimaculis]